MEQDDNTNPSLPDKTSPLTVDVPPDLLLRLLAPLGLQASMSASHVELHQDTVLANLRSQKWTERVTALQTLSKLNMPMPLDLVIGALNDENEHVRAAAARTLEKASDREASQPLLAALSDTSWPVRAAAAQTLGRLGSQTAIGSLTEIIRNDKDETVRASAAEALGRMGKATPLEPLLLALQDRTWLVREAAVSALGNLGQRVPLEPLATARLDSDISVRQAALIALQHTHPEAEITVSSLNTVDLITESQTQPLPEAEVTVSSLNTVDLVAENTVDLVAESQTQSLPEEETISDATPQASKRLLSLFGEMKRSLISVRQSVVYDPKRDTIQYIPPAARPPGRLLPKTQPLLRIGAIFLTIAGIIFTSFIFFGSHQSTVGSHEPSVCPAGLTTGRTSGCAFFKNSLEPTTTGQNGDQGLNDILEIDLANVPAPVSGKSYYAWLLSSPTNPEGATVFLHQLTVDQGNVHYVYQDPQQTDLLAATSAFLITEEPSSVQPLVPSLDRSTWRYYGVLSQTPDPNDTTNHYSVLDHLHHLLTADPQLEGLNLHGGLGIWLQRNSRAIMNLAQTAQNAYEQHDTQTIRTQLISILDYLDGSVYVSGDVPAGTALQIDPAIARVALLTFDSLNQMPKGYIQHIAYHLNSIIASPHATPYQKTLATELTRHLSTIETLLQQIRTDVKGLVNMNDSQLLQSNTGALLDTLATQIPQVYQGQASAPTGKSPQDGVLQLYQAIQTLATFGVQAYS